MTIENKKIKLKEMESLLKKAWSISNKLIGDEDTYSDNQHCLQQIRNGIESAQVRIGIVSYKKKNIDA